MAPTSDSLGSYPFSLSKPFVALDQPPGDVNNRIRDAQLLLALRNEGYDTQTSPQTAPTISLKESPLGGAVYAVNSPHSPNSADLPISVSGEVQGLRKRWLREHANLLQENISQVAKRARLSTTSGGDSLSVFEPTIVENGGNKSSPSGSQIHSQSHPRSSKISDSDHGSTSLTMSSTSSETRFSTTQLSCPDFLTADNERLRRSNQQLLSERDSIRAERDTLRRRMEGWVDPIEQILGSVLNLPETPPEVRKKLCELSQAVGDIRKELG